MPCAVALGFEGAKGGGTFGDVIHTTLQISARDCRVDVVLDERTEAAHNSGLGADRPNQLAAAALCATQDPAVSLRIVVTETRCEHPDGGGGILLNEFLDHTSIYKTVPFCAHGTATALPLPF
eukprot:SAG11_NODE_4432_length_1896_cov_2.442404_1_plen_122_part_10